MFTAPRAGHIGLGKSRAVFPERRCPERFLFGTGAPPAYRDTAGPGVQRLEQAAKCVGRRAKEKHVRPVRKSRDQGRSGRRSRQGMLPVDQYEKTAHVPAAVSMSRSSTWEKESPAAAIMAG